MTLLLLLLLSIASAGKHWCWVFWKYDVQTVEFARASEVLVRAWDSSMNTQPSHLTWNLMGMMNNCHFLIKIHQHVDAQVQHFAFPGFEVFTCTHLEPAAWAGNSCAGVQRTLHAIMA